MNRNILWWASLSVLLSFVLASCGDDEVTADPNSPWAVRNDAYLDSISRVCQSHPSDEKWASFLNYKLQVENNGNGFLPMWSKNDYVYAKYLPYGAEIEGGKRLEYSTDTVLVHYRGKLVDGTVFDQSYSGEWNKDVHEPVKFAVSQVITGWTTALLNMKEGERAELYIPYSLAYGEYGSGSIPGYSTLIFDLRLEKIIHPKGPDDRKLLRKE